MRITRPMLDEATLIRRATTALDARARAERLGELSLPHVAILGRIVTMGPITPGELADQLRMLPQSLTRPIASLERAGLVRRTADPADRRSALLEATEAGLEAIHDEMAPRTRWLAVAMTTICNEEERRTLAEAARVMVRLADHGLDFAPREP